MPLPDLQPGLKAVKEMGKSKTRPLLKEWQVEMLIEMLTDFYADPKNQQAFEAWQEERRKKRRAAKNKKPGGAANTDEL